MKRKLAMFMALMMMGLSVGCSNGDTGTDKTAQPDAAANTGTAAPDTAQKADGDYKLCVILKTLATEYWGYIGAGAKQAGIDLGIDVEVIGAVSEIAYDEQMNMIETKISSGEFDGFVIAPLQADTVATRIADITVPVVAVDTNIDSDKCLSFVGTGNEAAGEVGGKAAAEACDELGIEKTAVCIMGVQGDTTTETRLAGYKKGFEGAGGKVIEVQYCDSAPDKAAAIMESISQNYPDGVGAVLVSGDDYAIAAARAVKGNPAYEKTVFVGFDGITSACEAILDGRETLSVAQDGFGMGYKSVEACLKAAKGETIPTFIDTGASIVNKENAQERYDLLESYTAMLK
ncbi:sugar ABC transporter substrate-binding protein [Agathobaculum sp. NTUH-O15-33]|uniref:sugar ABC transporter substrate-binding protein n=1 Tax=Agathobaculum sp. NTUH-O15-33 TaxID=3079302 RepID=UPI00295873C6|nr:sugar ABC transporter substrate-binding protein [Agathobaculum sp. NTUH-O15-33]WNX83218.1 sugar ABC transporter substrate-binding protein [Agathobaculum sp. NTUH-O15-33]